MNSPLDDFDLDSIGIVAETAMADVRKDPLKWFRYSSEAQRKVVRYAATHEVALRSGNQRKAQPPSSPTWTSTTSR